MGCASSKFVPWAGRNEVTLAAKARKKAAKDVLAAYRAFSGCHTSYLDALKNTGHDLAVFTDQEDKALLSTRPNLTPPNPDVPAGGEPSTYQASWSKTPGALSETPVLEEIGKDGAAVIDEKEGFGASSAAGRAPPPDHGQVSPHESIYGSTDGHEQLGMPKNIPPPDNPPLTAANPYPPTADNQKAIPHTQTNNGTVSGTQSALVPVNFGGQTSWHSASGDQGARGAGLAQLGQNLQALFGEVEQAARPATDLLTCGMAKNFSALPPLPAQVQGYGVQPGVPRESLWEILEILVAYERTRCKEIKAMEKMKWEHARNSGRLAKQSHKQVSAERAEKQQKKINRTHTKVQTLQGTIQRLGQTVDNLSHSIDFIKGGLLLPAVFNLLPALAQATLHMAQIHDRQRQLVVEAYAGGALQGRHAAGGGVLFTQKSHQVNTEALESGLAKLEQAFDANFSAQKKFLSSMGAWLKKVDPTNAAAADKPISVSQYGQPVPQYGTSAPQNGNHGPQYGSQPPFAANQGYGVPHVTLPPESGQMIAYQAPGVGQGGPEIVGQFLGGAVSGGEPLLALCNDWLRAMEKLTDQSVRDSLHGFSSWVKEVLVKQNAEMKQAKKLDETRKQMTKAELKYDGLLRKEKEFRATLAYPNQGPMSRALSATQGTPPVALLGTSTPPLALPMSPSPHTSSPPGPSTNPDTSHSESLQLAAASPHTPGAIQPWQAPPPGTPPPEKDEAVDKAGAKALAKEQAKEVKAYQIAKEVDLAKGVLEGLKVKVREEQSALESMALDARSTAVQALEQGLPGLLQALAAYSAVASQMYGMLQYQHGRGMAPAH